MKIVVVKSPRLLSGLFRMIFKISKETPEELTPSEEPVFTRNICGFSA